MFVFVSISSTSPHNIKVRDAVIAEITKDPNSNFTSEVIKGVGVGYLVSALLVSLCSCGKALL
jgi:hypothetical protein